MKSFDFGLPHSGIHVSAVICTLTWLFAACHALHRSYMPRHPPVALATLICVNAQCALTFKFYNGNLDSLRLFGVWAGVLSPNRHCVKLHVSFCMCFYSFAFGSVSMHSVH